MCVSSLFINSIKVYRIYNCRPYPWLTYLYTVATMMGHGHNEHNTNNRIRYSEHYPKDFPLHWSLLPLVNTGLSSTLLNFSLSSKSFHTITWHSTASMSLRSVNLCKQRCKSIDRRMLPLGYTSCSHPLSTCFDRNRIIEYPYDCYLWLFRRHYLVYG